MPKPFMTYDQQIAKLKEKQLIIPDDAKAKEELRRVGYYALITGYKELFKNPMNDSSEIRHAPDNDGEKPQRWSLWKREEPS